MNIVFHYKNTKPKKEFEVLITSFSIAISEIIELPDTVEVCLYPFAPNINGGIDRTKVNRIGLNYNLLFQDIPLVLTHELIHVSQKHKGILKFDNKNNSYWYGVIHSKLLPEQMTYEEYENLPWEIDVRNKQTEVLQKALALLQQNT